jgi:hypothetical protein
MGPKERGQIVYFIQLQNWEPDGNIWTQVEGSNRKLEK